MTNKIIILKKNVKIKIKKFKKIKSIHLKFCKFIYFYTKDFFN
jgi:hypothetical protein